MAEHFDQIRDLLVHELKDLYDAEHQLLDALPKMAGEAQDPSLKQAFSHHLRETEQQVIRLERCFELLDIDAERETCQAMKGLIKEGKDVLKAKGHESVIDLALIASAQRVEHYEMAAYGAARTMASIIGEASISAELQETLDEEGAADKTLTELAMQLYAHAA